MPSATCFSVLSNKCSISIDSEGSTSSESSFFVFESFTPEIIHSTSCSNLLSLRISAAALRWTSPLRPDRLTDCLSYSSQVWPRTPIIQAAIPESTSALAEWIRRLTSGECLIAGTFAARKCSSFLGWGSFSESLSTASQRSEMYSSVRDIISFLSSIDLCPSGIRSDNWSIMSDECCRFIAIDSRTFSCRSDSSSSDDGLSCSRMSSSSMSAASLIVVSSDKSSSTTDISGSWEIVGWVSSSDMPPRIPNSDNLCRCSTGDSELPSSLTDIRSLVPRKGSRTVDTTVGYWNIRLRISIFKITLLGVSILIWWHFLKLTTPIVNFVDW